MASSSSGRSGRRGPRRRPAQSRPTIADDREDKENTSSSTAHGKHPPAAVSSAATALARQKIATDNKETATEANKAVEGHTFETVEELEARLLKSYSSSTQQQLQQPQEATKDSSGPARDSRNKTHKPLITKDAPCRYGTKCRNKQCKYRHDNINNDNTTTTVSSTQPHDTAANSLSTKHQVEQGFFVETSETPRNETDELVLGILRIDKAAVVSAVDGHRSLGDGPPTLGRSTSIKHKQSTNKSRKKIHDKPCRYGDKCRNKQCKYFHDSEALQDVTLRRDDDDKSAGGDTHYHRDAPQQQKHQDVQSRQKQEIHKERETERRRQEEQAELKLRQQCEGAERKRSEQEQAELQLQQQREEVERRRGEQEQAERKRKEEEASSAKEELELQKHCEEADRNLKEEQARQMEMKREKERQEARAAEEKCRREKDERILHEEQEREEEERLRKQRWQEEIRRQKEAAEKKRKQKKNRKEQRHQRYLEELQRQESARAQYWEEQAKLEETHSVLIKHLCAAEFVRISNQANTEFKSSGLTWHEVEERASKELDVHCHEAFHKLFGDTLQKRVKVAGFNQDLDGRQGTIKYWDAAKHKFCVALDSKKGKQSHDMFVKPGHLEVQQEQPQKGRKKKNWSGVEPVHYVDIKSLYAVFSIAYESGTEYCPVEKKVVLEMAELDSVDDFLCELMNERDEEERQRRLQEEEWKRQEERSRRRRAEQRRQEQAEYEARRREYEARKQQYEEWRKEQQRQEQFHRRGSPFEQSHGFCDCPRCTFAHLFADFSFGGGRQFFFEFGAEDDEYDSDQWDREWGRQQEEERMGKTVECAELLGVDPDAPPEVIKRAYRRQALKYHPDKYHPDKYDDGMTKQEAEEHFKEVTNAYDHLLSNFDDGDY